MNRKKNPSRLIRAARIIAVLLAGIFLVAPAHAQPVQERFLFIFDTSAAMKKRLPAVEKAIDTMLATSLGGRLHSGDDIGVWTFDHELRAGEFPLQHWSPENATTFASNLKVFIRKQRYAKDTSFDALQPLLSQIIRNSERLTVFIFCDGENEISWTPYDTGINQLFQQRQAERKKSLQPFVLALRSQLGEYTGCAVGLPPDSINLPEFPPLPAPEPLPSTAPASPPVAVPASQTPSLIIIGTRVGTNLPPPETKLVPTNSPVTNVVVMMITNPPLALPQTNLPVTVLTNPAAKTNAVVTPEKSGPKSSGSLVIGSILLAVAATLVILVLHRAGRVDRTSLITRSMNQKK
jgi:hypothetical protein